MLIAFVAAGVAANAAAFEHVSCKGGENEVRITISGVKQSAGLMTSELYRNEPDNFLSKRGREFRLRFAAHAPLTQFCLYAPAPGLYAIVAYHDKNANLKFDRSAIGLPKEPYGVSNNPKIRLAPPPISKALVEVPSTGVAIEIRLND
jgi:uncharacterized protein (DUF2141 family)